MTNQPSPISPQQLEREIGEQRAKLYANPTPSQAAIAAARNATTDLQARCSTLVIAEHGSAITSAEALQLQEDLRRAQTRLAELLAQQQRYAEAEARLKQDETRLAELQQQQRMTRIAEADRRLAAAHERVKHNARELCRAYRDACRIARANAAIPGASTREPGGFTIDAFVPYGWLGKTSEHIRDNSLAWLRDDATGEQERAA